MKANYYKKSFIIYTLVTLLMVIALGYFNYFLADSSHEAKIKIDQFTHILNIDNEKYYNPDSLIINYNELIKLDSNITTPFDSNDTISKISNVIHKQGEINQVNIINVTTDSLDHLLPLKNYLKKPLPTIYQYIFQLETTGPFLNVGKFLEQLVDHHLFIRSINIQPVPASQNVLASVEIGVFRRDKDEKK